MDIRVADRLPAFRDASLLSYHTVIMDHAFETVLRECQSPLRAYIAGRGVGSAMVDDLAQEAFVAYYKEQGRLPDGVEPLRWLKGIARNLCNQHFRGDERRRRLLVSIADHLEDLPAPQPAAAHDEEADRLRACLGRLPPRLQGLLHAYYGEEEDVAQLAQRHGLGMSGLRMAIHRAREQLRRCLGLVEA